VRITDMGTLGGFPNPPALWLQRAKPASANAANGNLGSLRPRHLPPTTPHATEPIR
jgi:hypothetical protein